MLASMTGYLRRHHVGVIALFIALGGTSYAAVKLPANSVGSKQIKNKAVRSPEVKNRSLKPEDFAAGTLLRGPAGARGATGPVGPRGPAGPPFAPELFPASGDSAGDDSTPQEATAVCEPGELAMGGYMITPPDSGTIEVDENHEVVNVDGVSTWQVVAREVGVADGDEWQLHAEAICVGVT